MIKVLFVHHSGGYSGAAKSVELLLSNIDKSKYIPYVLMLEDGPARKLFERTGAEVFVESRLGAFHGTSVSGMSFRIFMKNIFFLLPTHFYGKKVYEKINPDIVHLTSTCLFYHAKILKNINLTTPIITHVREPLLDSVFGKILRYMNHKYVDAYIAIEEYDLSKININNKLAKVVYNFVDFEIYNRNVKSTKLRNELQLNSESVIFLYLARISESNGTLEYVKSINKYEIDTQFKFIIVGATSNNVHEYEMKVKKEIEKNPNIYMLDFREDVPDLIASSDVVVVPFSKPHFSRTVIESAAMGIPSIVSDVKGLDELVENNKTGIIYNLSDPTSLINAIIKLGTEKAFREKLGANAEKRAKKLFNANTNAKEIFRVYDELLMR